MKRKLILGSVLVVLIVIVAIILAAGVAGRYAEGQKSSDEYHQITVSSDGKVLVQPPERDKPTVVMDR